MYKFNSIKLIPLLYLGIYRPIRVSNNPSSLALYDIFSVPVRAFLDLFPHTCPESGNPDAVFAGSGATNFVARCLLFEAKLARESRRLPHRETPRVCTGQAGHAAVQNRLDTRLYRTGWTAMVRIDRKV